MNDLDLCLEVVSRSCQSLRYIWRWISRKPLLGSKGPPIGNGIWAIEWSRDRWRHVTPKVLWSSTVGYLSDSLASCSIPFNSSERAESNERLLGVYGQSTSCGYDLVEVGSPSRWAARLFWRVSWSRLAEMTQSGLHRYSGSTTDGPRSRRAQEGESINPSTPTVVIWVQL